MLNYAIFINESVEPIAKFREFSDATIILREYVKPARAKVTIHTANGYEWITYHDLHDKALIRVSYGSPVPQSLRDRAGK